MTNRSQYNTVSNIGTPQGSLISPLFCNIYLHSLDKFVIDEVKPRFNRGKSRQKDSIYSKRYTLDNTDKQIIKKYPKIKNAILRAKHNQFVIDNKKKKGASVNMSDDSYRRLFYIRYADDFLIGFIGPRSEARLIFNEIKDFLLNELKLKINQEKSKIYNSGDRNIKYLGFYLRYYSHNQLKFRKLENTDEITSQVPALQAQAINNVQFRAPIKQMIQRLVDRNLAKTRKDGTVRATAYIKWSLLTEDQIVTRYSSIIRGLYNFYSCINKRSELWKVFHILRKSCALTLAHKLKLASAARIYAKYGPNLTIRNNIGQIKSTLFYPKSLKTKIDFKIRKDSIKYPEILDIEIDFVPGSSKLNIITGKVCEFEGCTNTSHLESHHLNPIANLAKRKDLSAFEKRLIARDCKVVMLCKKHHNILHKKRVFKSKDNGKKV